MSEQYKQEMLKALRGIQKTMETGRVELARKQLESLTKHLERYDAKPTAA